MQITDDMSSSANWYTSSAMGGQTFNTTVDGSAAMRVNSMQDTSYNGFWSWLLGSFYGWGSTSGNGILLNLTVQYQRKSGSGWMDAQGSLTYDIQVKVKKH